MNPPSTLEKLAGAALVEISLASDKKSICLYETRDYDNEVTLTKSEVAILITELINIYTSMEYPELPDPKDPHTPWFIAQILKILHTERSQKGREV